MKDLKKKLRELQEYVKTSPATKQELDHNERKAFDHAIDKAVAEMEALDIIREKACESIKIIAPLVHYAEPGEK